VKALILASEEEHPHEPFAVGRPGSGAHVGGRLVLEYLVEWLRHHGITEYIVRRPNRVTLTEEQCGDGQRFSHCYEGESLRQGTGSQQLDRVFSEPLLVVPDSVLTDLELSELVESHESKSDAAVTIVVSEAQDWEDSLVVELGDDDRITRLTKMTRPVALPTLCTSGIYIVDPEALRRVAPRVCSDIDFRQLPAALAKELPVYAYRATGYLLHVRSPECRARAEADLEAGRFYPDSHAQRRCWYVARSRPRAEWLAAAALEARGLSVFLPEWRGKRSRRGAPREPLFPGYVFVRTDGREDALLRARSAPNVVRLLSGASGPEPVPDALVTQIRRRCERQHEEPFVVGQKVRIAHGPFRELEAVFDAECSGGQRARVFVQMLRRLVPVIVEQAALRRAI
jgi:transcription antitermination factor NusG